MIFRFVDHSNNRNFTFIIEITYCEVILKPVTWNKWCSIKFSQKRCISVCNHFGTLYYRYACIIVQLVGIYKLLGQYFNYPTLSIYVSSLFLFPVNGSWRYSVLYFCIEGGYGLLADCLFNSSLVKVDFFVHSLDIWKPETWDKRHDFSTFMCYVKFRYSTSWMATC